MYFLIFAFNADSHELLFMFIEFNEMIFDEHSSHI